MKEFIYVEFLFLKDDYYTNYSKKLELLGDDFVCLKSEYEYEADNHNGQWSNEYIRVSGKINSMTASILKLQDPELTGIMRMSYISENLKDKYRK